MKKILNTILKLVLGILASGLTIIILQYLFGDIINVHKLYNLNWFIILDCFICFYLSGLITKNVSLKYIPILVIQFVPFFLLDKFYFPFNLILILFALFGLFLARKEFNIKYKILTLLGVSSVFIFYLLSQPLIIEKENFGTNMQGDYINAKLIWDFSNNEKSLPDLSFYNVQNEKVDLSEFSNKKIVVTFWATWCGPCLGEKPELEKLKTEFENNENIVFIDVSLDKNSESWKNYLRKKNPKGIQLISKDIGMDIASLKISGIPYRIILNEKENYKECRMLPFLGQILKQKDTIFNAFINQKKQFLEYLPTDIEKEEMNKF
jgi:thiol-disulfide isomerase/thioredoxin